MQSNYKRLKGRENMKNDDYFCLNCGRPSTDREFCPNCEECECTCDCEE